MLVERKSLILHVYDSNNTDSKFMEKHLHSKAQASFIIRRHKLILSDNKSINKFLPLTELLIKLIDLNMKIYVVLSKGGT